MAESLRPIPEKFPFWGDYWRRLVRSRLPPDHGTLPKPGLHAAHRPKGASPPLGNHEPGLELSRSTGTEPWMTVAPGQTTQRGAFLLPFEPHDCLLGLSSRLRGRSANACRRRLGPTGPWARSR